MSRKRDREKRARRAQWFADFRKYYPRAMAKRANFGYATGIKVSPEVRAIYAQLKEGCAAMERTGNEPPADLCTACIDCGKPGGALLAHTCPALATVRYDPPWFAAYMRELEAYPPSEDKCQRATARLVNRSERYLIDLDKLDPEVREYLTSFGKVPT